MSHAAVGATSSEPLAFTGWKDHVPAHYYNKAQFLVHQERRDAAFDDMAADMRRRSAATCNATARATAHQVWRSDIYQFGVYTGGGLAKWIQKLRSHNIRFKGTLYGFDSFVGMPSEDGAQLAPQHRQNRAWRAGGLNAAEQVGISSWTELQAHIVKNVGYGRTVLIRGFFNESLAPARHAAQRTRMRPALLIDRDSDLYSSASEALRFMLDNQLVVPGTYLYNDDVTQREWAYYRYKWAAKRPWAVYESARALLEAARDYGLEFDEVPPATPGLPPKERAWRATLLRLRRVCARDARECRTAEVLHEGCRSR